MKYMLIMRATDEGLAAMQNADLDEMLETVGKFTTMIWRCPLAVRD